jgi:EAL domain-containing protein (putative c-di-GMP-specific phosphodiesterase class I)
VDVRFTVSLALCEPGDDAAGDLRTLLRHAEEARSQAKQQRLAGLWYERADPMARRLARLRLEITESRLMHDADRALPVKQALRDAGVHRSIDDLGTGYSSLSYLQRLPVSELKIDRSFVDRADESAELASLLLTIIRMGHGLHMQVTAEGVERHEELALLKGLGCDRAQGYLIARPMPLAAAASWAGLPQAQTTQPLLG